MSQDKIDLIFSDKNRVMSPKNSKKNHLDFLTNYNNIKIN